MQEKPQHGNDEPRSIIGEPIIRPDGNIVRIWHIKENSGEYVMASVKSSALYLKEEVELLGEGNFMQGTIKIAQSYYSAPEDALHAGTTRLLDAEIENLKLLKLEGF